MIKKADEKNSNWREKYLDALDQQEQQEKAFFAQQELLRRALVRVSVSADGQDETLDSVLSQLRENLRGTIGKDIGIFLNRLDQAGLEFEQRREKNTQIVRQSLTDTLKPLQELELSRAIKKEIVCWEARSDVNRPSEL
jgi:diguanylate cyclase